MSALQDAITNLETFAEQEWQKVEATAVSIEQETVPEVETALVTALEQFGEFAVTTVMGLFSGANASLSGSEKLNLAATTIKANAATAGVTLLDHIVTALAENAYTVVMGTAPAT